MDNENKDTAPQKIPITDNSDNTAVNDEAVKDMTVDAEGTMQDENMSTEPVNEVSAPEAMMDVSPPPQDEVVVAPVLQPAPEEADTQDEPAEAPTEQVFSPVGADPVTPAAVTAKKSGKGLIMAIAIILALVLASIAVLVYLKLTSSTKSAATIPDTTTVTKVTATDVDATTTEVDTALSSLDDTKDFGGDVISDKALGLQ